MKPNALPAGLIAFVLLAAGTAAVAAPRGAEPPQVLHRQAPALTRPAGAVLKPDIQPVKPVVNGTSSSTSGYPPGLGALSGRLYAKNNGPGKLESSFSWRLSCQVIAKEFPLGPCLYNSYQQAKNTQGGFPEVTASGAMSGLPATAGQQVMHQLINMVYVNCRHDMGGKCHIKLEVDTTGKVSETNESNNSVSLWYY